MVGWGMGGGCSRGVSNGSRRSRKGKEKKLNKGVILG